MPKEGSKLAEEQAAVEKRLADERLGAETEVDEEADSRQPWDEVRGIGEH